ncbi:hypothetical protein HMN09_00164000 [Mycena chlorophos]|uniref:DUF6534 domain-containing protein n=1 Tax=Mycena chlorophos TaxID=658473 RepID=A0A8H6WKH9_MYCCL|nr:hypothetical protein HMN09_00164000 [Mycena chlorophos]
MAVLPRAPTEDVRLSYGPLLVGVFFNMILFGVSATQQLSYVQSSNRDRPGVRILIWCIFFVLVANTALDMYMMYQPLILEYGAPLYDLPTVFVSQPLSVVLVGFPTQVFFIWRIYALSKIRIIPIAIFLCSLLSLAGGIWTTVMVPIVASFPNVPLLYRSAEVWLISSAVTDLSIAASLAAILRGHKTGFRATDTLVDKLIRMTVQTGLITALCSVLDVVCFLTPALRGKTVNFIWNIPLPKLYAICLMSTLNARDSLREAFAGTTHAMAASADYGRSRRSVRPNNNYELELDEPGLSSDSGMEKSKPGSSPMPGAVYISREEYRQ